MRGSRGGRTWHGIIVSSEHSVTGPPLPHVGGQLPLVGMKTSISQLSLSLFVYKCIDTYFVFSIVYVHASRPPPPPPLRHTVHPIRSCRTGGDHWIASFIVCVTGSALLLAFSFTACSDPGIVYRPAERLAEEAGGGGAGGAAVTDTVSSPAAMEGGGVLCGEWVSE